MVEWSKDRLKVEINSASTNSNSLAIIGIIGIIFTTLFLILGYLLKLNSLWILGILTLLVSIGLFYGYYHYHKLWQKYKEML